jgi:hypothetical protein
MVFSSSAFAQRYDKKTTVTLSAPVEIPGGMMSLGVAFSMRPLCDR